MRIPSEAWVALLNAGVRVRQLDSHRIELAAAPSSASDRGSDFAVTDQAGQTWVVEAKYWNRALTPTIIQETARRLPSQRVLAIAPTISKHARAMALDYGWSVIAINPTSSAGPYGVLALPDDTRQVIGKPPELDEQDEDELGGDGIHQTERKRGWKAAKGRPAYGAGQIVRALLSGRQFTQAQLAELTGLSQPRISQTIGDLRRKGLVRAVDHLRPLRWEPITWDALLDHWLATYGGPGGTRTYWYGLEGATQTADQILRLLAPGEVDRNSLSTRPMPIRNYPALSGPVAADRIAPWARAQVAVIYTSVGADLGEVGLTPSAPEEATIQLVVPDDIGVWAVPDMWPWQARLMADPMQILWDVLNPIGIQLFDVDQMAAHLRARLADVAAHNTDRL